MTFICYAVISVYAVKQLQILIFKEKPQISTTVTSSAFDAS
jgi:hypothetical protein